MMSLFVAIQSSIDKTLGEIEKSCFFFLNNLNLSLFGAILRTFSIL